MITIEAKGDLTKTEKFLMKIPVIGWRAVLSKYAEEGVNALKASTPIDSGETRNSWGYTLEKTANGFSIIWTNSHVNKGVPIAVILQYGHGTGTGGYVQGRDYINPAMRPVFDQMAEAAWREVSP